MHPISNLIDLKRRLGIGRRCFGYIHPAIPGQSSYARILIRCAKMDDSSGLTNVSKPFNFCKGLNGSGWVDLKHFLSTVFADCLLYIIIMNMIA